MMTAKDISQKISDGVNELTVLGGAYEIAEYFRVIGCKGYRDMWDACPVHRYLTDERFVGVGVDMNIFVDAVSISCIIGDVSTPEVIMEFIRGFDNDRYPEIDADIHTGRYPTW